MNTDSQNINSQTPALVFMLLAVLSYSLLPFLVEVAVSRGSLLMATGTWLGSTAVARLGFVGVVGAKYFRPNQNQDTAGSRLRRCGQVIHRGVSWIGVCLKTVPRAALVIMFFTTFQWAFFAWSARLVEVAVTTIIYEFWPVLFLLGRRFVVAKTDRAVSTKRQVPLSDLFLAVVAGVGLAFVIFSEQGDTTSSYAGSPLAGIGLAFIALSLTGVGAVTNITVGERNDRLPKLLPSSSQKQSSRLETLSKVCLSVSVSAAPRMVAATILIGAGTAQIIRGGGSLSWSGVGVGVLLGVAQGVASGTFIAANHLSRSDLINTLYYGVPIVALGWLWLFTEVTVANPTMFLLGVAIIVGTNGALQSKQHRAVR